MIVSSQRRRVVALQPELELRRPALVGSSGEGPCLPPHRVCVPRSIGASALSGAIEIVVLLPLVEWLGLNYLVAVCAAMAVAQAVLFALNKYWAFEARRGNAGQQAARHVVLAAGTFAGNLLLTFILREWVGLHYLVAFFGASALVFAAWSYPGARWFVFARDRASRDVVVALCGRGSVALSALRSGSAAHRGRQ